MSDDIQKWFEYLEAKHREAWNLLVELGWAQGIRQSVVEKYADPAHYPYELLQNAEDQEADKVSLRYDSRRHVATFEHDGKPFLREDIKNITGIGNTKKPEQPNKIGRFGVGFKSVFVVSDRPEVYCELEGRPFAFAIENLVVPSQIEGIGESGKGMTRFKLPIRDDKQDRAVQHLKESLDRAMPEALLFLRHVKRLELEVEGEKRVYTRECKTGQCGDMSIHDVRLSGRCASKDSQRRYLVFERAVDSAEKERNLSVALAFLFDDGGKKLVREKQSPPLHVFFETEDRPGLYFRLHGPFLLTDNRANLKRGESHNEKLVDECARLLVGALPELKRRGLLVADFLAVLPRAEDQLMELWPRVREAVVKAMKEGAFVPTHKGDHAPAGILRVGESEIRALLDDQGLQFFTGKKELRWAAGVSARAKAFMEKTLEIPSWDKNELTEELKKFGCYPLEDSQSHLEWLKGKTDDWMRRFYALLSGFSLGFGDELQIVRTEDGSHVVGSKAHFPAEGGREGLLFVRKAVLEGKSRKQSEQVKTFLEKCGVGDVSESVRIQGILDTYYASHEVQVEPELHHKHLKQFVRFPKERGDGLDFRKYYIFRENLKSGSFLRGAELYMDAPVHKTGLDAVYGPQGPLEGEKYQFFNIDVDGFADFAVRAGVHDRIEIRREEQVPVKHPDHRQLTQDGCWRPTSKASDWRIEGIEKLVASKNVAVSLQICRTMNMAGEPCLLASFQRGSEYTHRSASSSLVYALRQASWLPDTAGNFKKPSELTAETLHPDFQHIIADDNIGWLKAVLFAKQAEQASEAKESLREKYGENADDDRIKEFSAKTKEEQKRLLKLERPSQPEKTAEEWLGEHLKEKAQSWGWTVVPKHGGRDFRLEKKDKSLNIEVKKVSGPGFISWSKEQYDTAKDVQNYFIALLHKDAASGYAIAWVRHPLRDLVHLERKGVWKLSDSLPSGSWNVALSKQIGQIKCEFLSYQITVDERIWQDAPDDASLERLKQELDRL